MAEKICVPKIGVEGKVDNAEGKVSDQSGAPAFVEARGTLFAVDFLSGSWGRFEVILLESDVWHSAV